MGPPAKRLSGVKPDRGFESRPPRQKKDTSSNWACFFDSVVRVSKLPVDWDHNLEYNLIRNSEFRKIR